VSHKAGRPIVNFQGYVWRRALTAAQLPPMTFHALRRTFLAGTRRHLAVIFSLLVTAQQVRSYKPAPGHFIMARDRIGAQRWLHAAQSYFQTWNPPSPTVFRSRGSTGRASGRPGRRARIESFVRLLSWRTG